MPSTGFYYSDPRQQLNKHYKYHGTNFACNKPPNPDPILDYPTEAESSGWELLYFNDTVSGYTIQTPVIWSDFLPTDLNDLCYQKAPDGKKRIYCFEAFVYRDPDFGFFQFNWGAGMICALDGVLSGSDFMRIAHADYVSGGDNPFDPDPLLYGSPVGEGTWYTVYRSKTGLIPSGPYPFSLTIPAPWD